MCRARACANICWPWKRRCAATRGCGARTKRAGASSRSCTTTTTRSIRIGRTIRTAASSGSSQDGYPEWVTRAILSHADYSGVTRESRLEKTLFACDELSGFITAAALVRPSKSVLDLEASSVMKRMKDKAFARAVPREDIHKGADRARPAARRAHHQRHPLPARTRRRARPSRDALSRQLPTTRTRRRARRRRWRAARSGSRHA